MSFSILDGNTLYVFLADSTLSIFNEGSAPCGKSSTSVALASISSIDVLLSSGERLATSVNATFSDLSLLIVLTKSMLSRWVQWLTSRHEAP